MAETLREAAGLLAQQDADPFRVQAYRKAAQTIEQLDQDVAVLATKGPEALDALPHIGKSLAAAVVELATTGRWPQLERLRGALDPEQVFQGIPGIGPVFARLIHDHLHVDTLEALEAAAHDGRLDTVPGIGPRRSTIIRHSLANLLSRRRIVPVNPAQSEPPPVAMLLDVDEEYRRKAQEGALKLIAPKRFNPQGKAWLPILHTEREPWHFTALYSNTARAHELGRTADWVVIFFTTDHTQERQCTAVTETTGTLKGKRVIRGRERECAEYWQGQSSPPAG